jgi:hypothetical protein
MELAIACSGAQIVNLASRASSELNIVAYCNFLEQVHVQQKYYIHSMLANSGASIINKLETASTGASIVTEFAIEPN